MERPDRLDQRDQLVLQDQPEPPEPLERPALRGRQEQQELQAQLVLQVRQGPLERLALQGPPEPQDLREPPAHLFAVQDVVSIPLA